MGDAAAHHRLDGLGHAFARSPDRLDLDPEVQFAQVHRFSLLAARNPLSGKGIGVFTFTHMNASS